MEWRGKKRQYQEALPSSFKGEAACAKCKKLPEYKNNESERKR